MLKATEKLLPRSTTTYSFWLYHLVATSTDSHCSMRHVPCHFVSFFPFENRVLKCQKCGTFICEQLAKVSKIYCFINFPSWLSYKDWKMSLYKPGQVRACFCWITEKSQIIQLKISFHHDNFRVDFFQRRKFCHI